MLKNLYFSTIYGILLPYAILVERKINKDYGWEFCGGHFGESLTNLKNAITYLIKYEPLSSNNTKNFGNSATY